MFWSHEKLESECDKNPKLIQPFDKDLIKYGAYELRLGDEVFITSGATATKQKLEPGEQVRIPPGQFGLLMTEERLAIPNNAIGFISIKFSIKQRGLINVSGFHVDPGFPGRLKFAVYNAGSADIRMARGERVFLIWFSDLDRQTKYPYKGDHVNQDGITSEDIMRLQGKIASPAALQKQIDDLRSDHDRRLHLIDRSVKLWRGLVIGFVTSIFSILTAIIGGLIVGLTIFFLNRIAPPIPPSQPASPSATAQPKHRNEPKSDVTPSPAPTNTPESKPTNGD